jgi:hypothetical protein
LKGNTIQALIELNPEPHLLLFMEAGDVIWYSTKLHPPLSSGPQHAHKREQYKNLAKSKVVGSIEFSIYMHVLYLKHSIMDIDRRRKLGLIGR